eukprot:TRINITY_DN767_c0_g1_i1.p1 TRINITY_DN767_c0_g1~~TRINITY_DN767_c0_g1_i1.p1  ORF type:complete len:365 (-),score=92.91 TRINITY_DN767_c0_g1_i1:347-1390(-)
MMKIVVVLLCMVAVCACGGIGGASEGEKCLGSAGYTWCAFEGKCVRPWELAKEKGLEMSADNINSYCQVKRIGGSQDNHGCVTTAGYSWCAKEKNCVRPWELATARQISINTVADFNNYCSVNTTTPTPEVGNDSQDKCQTSAGYSWCQKENKCVQPWELMKTLQLESTPATFQTYCANCLASAGYSYCYAEKKCVRPWELAKELAIASTPESINAYCAQDPATKTVSVAAVGGATDEHGCVAGAGYSWCQKENKCVQPWEITSAQQIENTPEAFDQYCNEVHITGPLMPGTQAGEVGGDADTHGCMAGAGFSWCQKENRCVRPWELAQEKGIVGTMTAETFASYCN